MDMIVEIQATQLLTWNFARNVIELRYFLDYQMPHISFIAVFWRNNRQIYSKGKKLFFEAK